MNNLEIKSIEGRLLKCVFTTAPNAAKSLFTPGCIWHTVPAPIFFFNCPTCSRWVSWSISRLPSSLSRFLFPRTNSNGVDLWAMVFLFFLIIPRWEMKPTTIWSADNASTECCDPCQGAAELCRVFRLQMLVRRRHSVKTQEEQYNGSFTVNITHHTSRSPTSCPCFERRWRIREQTTTGLGSGGGNSEFSITSKINWRL